MIIGLAPAAVAMPAPAIAPIALSFQQVKLRYISPSAIETFADCPRKWAFAKLDHEPKKESASAILGSAVHAQHEQWLRDAIPYDLSTKAGEIAYATLQYLPAPRSGIVEQEFTWQIDELTLGGKIDWIGRVSDRAVVLDHKTGNPDYFKLSLDALMAHPQAPIYAAYALSKLPPHERVELRWNYVTTSKPYKPMPSWHVVSRERASIALSKFLPIARELANTVAHANTERAAGRTFGAMQVAYNAASCTKYGGCPYRSKCNLSATEETQAIMGTLSENLAARNATPGAAPVQPQYQLGAQVNGHTLTEQGWIPTIAPVAPPPPPVAQHPAAPPLAYGAPPAAFGPVNPPESVAPGAPLGLPVVAQAPAPVTPPLAGEPAERRSPGRPRKARTTPEGAPESDELAERVLVALAGNPVASQANVDIVALARNIVDRFRA